MREGSHDALVIALGKANEEWVDQLPAFSSQAESDCRKVVCAVEEGFFRPSLLARGEIFNDERTVFLDVLNTVDEPTDELEGLSLNFVFGVLEKSHVESL